MTEEIQMKIDAIKAPFHGVIEAADALPALVDAREKVQYDLGFEDGLKQAGQAGGSGVVIVEEYY